MKAQYVREKFLGLMVFGTYPDGRVDVCDTEANVVLSGVSRDVADIVLREHDKVLDALCAACIAFANADNEAFNKYWEKA